MQAQEMCNYTENDACEVNMLIDSDNYCVA